MLDLVLTLVGYAILIGKKKLTRENPIFIVIFQGFDGIKSQK
jgi:hypothetical protein